MSTVIKWRKVFAVAFAVSIAAIVSLFLFWPKAHVYRAQLVGLSAVLFFLAYIYGHKK